MKHVSPTKKSVTETTVIHLPYQEKIFMKFVPKCKD